jgi:hypothetical protein
MPSFTTALDQLAAMSVSGVRNHYAVATLPDELSRAQLPALLVLPFVAKDRLFPERGEGFQTMAFSEGTRTITYAVTHLLLVASVGSGSGQRSALPKLVTLIDAYFTALNTDPTFGSTLSSPARVRVEPGLYRHGSFEYFGCAFRHLWALNLDPVPEE